MIILPFLIALGVIASVASRPSAPTPPAVTSGRHIPRHLMKRHHAQQIVRYIQSRTTPPVTVINLAIEEARAVGDRDMLAALVERYIIPMLQAANIQPQAQLPAAPVPYPGYAPAPLAAAPSLTYSPPQAAYPQAQPPQAQSPYAPTQGVPMMPPEYAADYPAVYPSSADPMPPEYPADFSQSAQGGGGYYPSAPAPQAPQAPQPPTQSMQGPQGAQGPITSPSQVSMSSQPPNIVSATDDDILQMLNSLSGPAPSVVVQPGPANAQPVAPAAPTATAGTITVSGRSSPIPGISNDDWTNFAGRIARELPTFEAANHVGQFRQHKARVSELGFNPAHLVGSPEAQYHALNADMQDAHRRAQSTGITNYVGSTIQIPTPQGPAPVQVTLSGVLGVIQAAGVSGAPSWFSTAADRHQFPNTTSAFLRSNGLF